jgi:hypothetical protein
MDFSKFITVLLGVYLAYYSLNFLYDGFIKKKNKPIDDGEDEEVLSFVGDMEEDVEPIAVVEKKKVIEPETAEIQKIFEQEPIVLQVETQGIPYSLLMADSKQIFTGLF